MIVYAVMHNPCVYESDFGVSSLHASKTGAAEAMDKLKRKETKRNGGYLPVWEVFCIRKMKVRT